MVFIRRLRQSARAVLANSAERFLAIIFNLSQPHQPANDLQ